MKIYFKNWLETTDDSLKDIILNYLKDKIHISNVEKILDLKIKDIDKQTIKDLISRGIIQSIPEELQSEIKNGDISVAELISKISNHQD